MIIYLAIPLLIVYLATFGIATSVLVNTYVIPFLGLTAKDNIGIAGGVIIVGVLTALYFILFSKKLENEKFKDYLFSKRK